MADRVFKVCDFTHDEDTIAVDVLVGRFTIGGEEVKHDVCQYHKDLFSGSGDPFAPPKVGGVRRDGQDYPCPDPNCDHPKNPFKSAQERGAHKRWSGHHAPGEEPKAVPIAKPAKNPADVIVTEFACSECGKKFPTTQQRGSHQWTAHGIRKDGSRAKRKTAGTKKK